MLCVITGWNQFDLDFFVSAPKTSSIDGSHHKMTVFDNRLVPGDTADFPAVSPLLSLAFKLIKSSLPCCKSKLRDVISIMLPITGSPQLVSLPQTLIRLNNIDMETVEHASAPQLHSCKLRGSWEQGGKGEEWEWHVASCQARRSLLCFGVSVGCKLHLPAG